MIELAGSLPTPGDKPMIISLKGKVALVTGSSRGIGRQTAIKFAGAGAEVIVNFRDPHDSDEAERVSEQIRNMGRNVMIVRADVSRPSEVLLLMSNIKDRFGKLDILVNNAGIAKDRTLAKMTEQDWDDVLATNLKGTWLCSKHALEFFFRHSKSGKVINLSSVIGMKGNFGQANYAASKSGLVGLTLTMAREFARYNVSVIAVAPGFVNTRMWQVIPDERKKEILQRILLGRVAEPEEIANVLLFLASDLASYITGAVVPVDGGYFG